MISKTELRFHLKTSALFIILVYSFFVSICIAQSQDRCSEYDFSNHESFQNPGDQGNFPWCTAYSAAKIVGFYEKQLVSPIDISIESLFHDLPVPGPNRENIRHRFIIQNLNINTVFDFINTKGVCSADNQSFQTPPGNGNENLEAMERLQSENQRICQFRTPSKYLYKLTHGSPSQFSNLIDSKIWKTNPRPILISLELYGLFYPKTANKSDIHMLPLIARRWDPLNKTCFYALANSFGKDCSFITNATSKLKCNPINGQIFISEKLLKKQIFQFHDVKTSVK